MRISDGAAPGRAALAVAALGLVVVLLGALVHRLVVDEPAASPAGGHVELVVSGA